MTVLHHAADCAWHVDQRDADCDCGRVPEPRRWKQAYLKLDGTIEDFKKREQLHPKIVDALDAVRGLLMAEIMGGIDDEETDEDCGSQIRAWIAPGRVPNRILVGVVPDYLTEDWAEKLRLSAPHARRLGMQLLQHAAAAEAAAVSDYETRPCDVEVGE